LAVSTLAVPEAGVSGVDAAGWAGADEAAGDGLVSAGFDLLSAGSTAADGEVAPLDSRGVAVGRVLPPALGAGGCCCGDGLVLVA